MHNFTATAVDCYGKVYWRVIIFFVYSFIAFASKYLQGMWQSSFR
jgi:hypothetical protein